MIIITPHPVALLRQYAISARFTSLPGIVGVQNLRLAWQTDQRGRNAEGELDRVLLNVSYPEVADVVT